MTEELCPHCIQSGERAPTISSGYVRGVSKRCTVRRVDGRRYFRKVVDTGGTLLLRLRGCVLTKQRYQ